MIADMPITGIGLNTFPVILIVIGAISLASNLAPTDGHISRPVPPTPTMSAPPPAQNPQGPGQGR